MSIGTAKLISMNTAFMVFEKGQMFIEPLHLIQGT